MKKKKKKEIAGDIIILQMCTKSHNHMKYSSWDMELDIIFCHFGPSFALLLSPPPNNQEKQNFEKNEKSIWRCHHFKLVQQKTWSYDVCLLRYGVRQRECIVILGHFLLFFPTYWPRISTIGKNVKNTWRYYPFTYVYHKSRSYDPWFLRYKVQRTGFRAIFAPWPF